MTPNVGTVDRIIRVIIGVVAAYLGYRAGGAAAWVGYVVAVIMLGTAALGWCALYRLFGINTCAVKK
ncbi:YgaP family membrane protein [Caldinitratiruptor microaerophilus]|uniref:Inner membrane protein YgaP-like transmembrane domain-containing protein n=1 Tax=Caldinitratiruptor microaerophilus TaxID=671077 RepID=A0AA35G8J5_9FIRM|nr:DUF2892 domain-containing protein [Caldinitratiruptor microaerophilus]BDG59329.1 hypothetical protein caldi_04190 [Caldinitratiruptor microaerophilus]